MPKGFHRVGLLKEVGTVTGQAGSLMPESHMTFDYLGHGIIAKLVIEHLVGMNEIDTLIRLLARAFLTGRSHSLQQA